MHPSWFHGCLEQAGQVIQIEVRVDWWTRHVSRGQILANAIDKWCSRLENEYLELCARSSLICTKHVRDKFPCKYTLPDRAENPFVMEYKAVMDTSKALDPAEAYYFNPLLALCAVWLKPVWFILQQKCLYFLLTLLLLDRDILRPLCIWRVTCNRNTTPNLYFIRPIPKLMKVSSRVVTRKTSMEMRRKKFHQTPLSLVARTLTCGLKLVVSMQETRKPDDHAQVTSFFATCIWLIVCLRSNLRLKHLYLARIFFCRSIRWKPSAVFPKSFLWWVCLCLDSLMCMETTCLLSTTPNNLNWPQERYRVPFATTLLVIMWQW